MYCYKIYISSYFHALNTTHHTHIAHRCVLHLTAECLSQSVPVSRIVSFCNVVTYNNKILKDKINY